MPFDILLRENASILINEVQCWFDIVVVVSVSKEEVSQLFSIKFSGLSGFLQAGGARIAEGLVEVCQSITHMT